MPAAFCVCTLTPFCLVMRQEEAYTQQEPTAEQAAGSLGSHLMSRAMQWVEWTGFGTAAAPTPEQTLRSLSATAGARALPSADGIVVEHVGLRTEPGEQGLVPVLLAKSRSSEGRLPTVILLHATGHDRLQMWPQMLLLARRGYLAVSIDSRYHGARATEGTDTYKNALIRSWRGIVGKERAFLMDTAYDLIRVVDHLLIRPDVDAARIGMTGISLGGMHTVMAAAADTRISVAVPLIGVQSFNWALEHDQWQARVASIPWVFEAAAADMEREAVDADVVEAVWERIAPGLLDMFDAATALPLIAPRPLLVLNGALDARNPTAGLATPVDDTLSAYHQYDSPSLFRVQVRCAASVPRVPQRKEKSVVLTRACESLVERSSCKVWGTRPHRPCWMKRWRGWTASFSSATSPWPGARVVDSAAVYAPQRWCACVLLHACSWNLLSTYGMRSRHACSMFVDCMHPLIQKARHVFKQHPLSSAHQRRETTTCRCLHKRTGGELEPSKLQPTSHWCHYLAIANATPAAAYRMDVWPADTCAEPPMHPRDTLCACAPLTCPRYLPLSHSHPPSEPFCGKVSAGVWDEGQLNWLMSPVDA